MPIIEAVPTQCKGSVIHSNLPVNSYFSQIRKQRIFQIVRLIEINIVCCVTHTKNNYTIFTSDKWYSFYLSFFQTSLNFIELHFTLNFIELTKLCSLSETNYSLHKKYYTVKIFPLYNKIWTINLVRNLTPIFGRGEETQDTTFDMKFDINLLRERRRAGDRHN